MWVRLGCRRSVPLLWAFNWRICRSQWGPWGVLHSSVCHHWYRRDNDADWIPGMLWSLHGKCTITWFGKLFYGLTLREGDNVGSWGVLHSGVCYYWYKRDNDADWIPGMLWSLHGKCTITWFGKLFYGLTLREVDNMGSLGVLHSSVCYCYRREHDADWIPGMLWSLHEKCIITWFGKLFYGPTLRKGDSVGSWGVLHSGVCCYWYGGDNDTEWIPGLLWSLYGKCTITWFGNLFNGLSLRGNCPQTKIEHILSPISKLSTFFWTMI